MVNELKWESLESRREQLSLTMLYNILKQNVYLPPEYILEFHLQTSQYQLQTRSCHMFRLIEPFCNTTDTYKYSFIPSTSRQWNVLPRYIFEVENTGIFKSLLVTIILQSIAKIIYYIISVYILLFVKFSQQKKKSKKK